MAWSAIPVIAQDLFIVSSDYEAPDADPPGLVCKSLSSEFGVAVVPVRKGGHLVQIEQPEVTEQIVREHLRARG